MVGVIEITNDNKAVLGSSTSERVVIRRAHVSVLYKCIDFCVFEWIIKRIEAAY